MSSLPRTQLIVIIFFQHHKIIDIFHRSKRNQPVNKVKTETLLHRLQLFEQRERNILLWKPPDFRRHLDAAKIEQRWNGRQRVGQDRPRRIGGSDLEGRDESRDGNSEVVESPSSDAARKAGQFWTSIHVDGFEARAHLADGGWQLDLDKSRENQLDLICDWKDWKQYLG